MPQRIVRLKDRYLEWSTLVDAPVSQAMTREKLDAYMRNRLGDTYMEQTHPLRMKTVDKWGTSREGLTAEELVAYNRAGPDESSISIDEILQRYGAEA